MKIYSKFRGLKTLKRVLNPAPGIPAFNLGNSLYQQRKHAQFYVSLDAPGHPMIYRTHLELSPFHGTEAPFDDHQAFVAAGRILKGDGVVIGLDDPLAVILFRFLDFATVNADSAALCNREIPFVAFGCQKTDGPSGRGLSALMSVEFLLKKCDDLRSVLLLPLCLGGIITEEHDDVRFKLRNANRSNDFRKKDRNLPIKYFNLRSNEELLTQRAKKRPGIILSAEIDTFSDIEKLLRRKGKKHLQEDCMFVVPCYGIETPDKGSGFPSEMVSRIRCCLYRQFFYCPAHPLLYGEHIARFDRVQVVIGKDRASIEPIEFALAPEPFDIFLAMFLFCISGEEDGDLEAVRQITKKCYDELKIS